MSDATTRKMIKEYTDDVAATDFFAGMFKSPRENFHDSEEVEFDIQRSGEDIAIPVLNGSGYRTNTLDAYTNKSVIPPVLKESVPIKAADLVTREMGENPFASTSFQAKANKRALRAMRQIDPMLRRTMELQASQVLQTGIVSLIDKNGVVQYSLDFGMKASHKITSGTAWSGAGDPMADLAAACEVNRNDGKLDSDMVVMGDAAFKAFSNNASVQPLFDTRRIDIGSLSTMQGRAGTAGGNYRGTIDVENYKLDIFTYGGRYTHPQTGASTKFLTPANAIVMASAGRKDATFGAIPRLVPPDSRVLKYLPRRFRSSLNSVDLHVNAWLDNTGETLHVGIGSRPLMIPTAIDTYSTIDTLSV